MATSGHRGSALVCGALLAASVGASGAAYARVAEKYALTVSQPSSSLNYTFSTMNPFTGTLTGSPGDAGAVPPIPPTRLKLGTPGAFCLIVNNCDTIAAGVNDTVAISGSIVAAGSAGSTPIRPTGAYTLTIDAAASTVSVSGFSTHLLASGPISSTAYLQNLTYQRFCAIRGAAAGTSFCTAFYCVPITLAFGTVSVTTLNAVQQPGNTASGTLTATANPDVFTFTLPVTLTMTAAANFSGAPVVADPQAVPATLSGTITRAAGGASASVTSTLEFTASQTNTPNPPTPSPTTPITLPPDAPICQNLDVATTITVTSSSVTTAGIATLVASGPRQAVCRCDVNGTGGLSIDDLFIYLNLWFSNAPGSDFDGMNGTSIDDLFLFLNCWFSGPFPC